MLLKAPMPFQHFVEVHLVPIKLRTIHAYEFGLSSDGDSASSTHAGTIYHNRIQGYIRGDFVFLCQQTNKFHHDGGADTETFVYLLALDDFLHAFRHQSFASVRAVIGHDDDFVGAFAHLLFKDNEFLGASSQHGDDAVTGSF